MKGGKTRGRSKFNMKNLLGTFILLSCGSESFTAPWLSSRCRSSSGFCLTRVEDCRQNVKSRHVPSKYNRSIITKLSASVVDDSSAQSPRGPRDKSESNATMPPGPRGADDANTLHTGLQQLPLWQVFRELDHKGIDYNVLQPRVQLEQLLTAARARSFKDTAQGAKYPGAQLAFDSVHARLGVPAEEAEMLPATYLSPERTRQPERRSVQGLARPSIVPNSNDTMTISTPPLELRGAKEIIAGARTARSGERTLGERQADVLTRNRGREMRRDGNRGVAMDPSGQKSTKDWRVRRDAWLFGPEEPHRQTRRQERSPRADSTRVSAVDLRRNPTTGSQGEIEEIQRRERTIGDYEKRGRPREGLMQQIFDHLSGATDDALSWMTKSGVDAQRLAQDSDTEEERESRDPKVGWQDDGSVTRRNTKDFNGILTERSTKSSRRSGRGLTTGFRGSVVRASAEGLWQGTLLVASWAGGKIVPGRYVLLGAGIFAVVARRGLWGFVGVLAGVKVTVEVLRGLTLAAEEEWRLQGER